MLGEEHGEVQTNLMPSALPSKSVRPVISAQLSWCRASGFLHKDIAVRALSFPKGMFSSDSGAGMVPLTNELLRHVPRRFKSSGSVLDAGHGRQRLVVIYTSCQIEHVSFAAVIFFSSVENIVSVSVRI